MSPFHTLGGSVEKDSARIYICDAMIESENSLDKADEPIQEWFWLPVRVNLVSATKHVRHEQESLKVWIDAICMD